MAGKIREEINTYQKSFIQFIKFNFVGITNTLIDFGVFSVLSKVFNIHFFMANTISFISGITNSFILNKIWTFGKKHRFSTIEVVKFVIVNLVTFGGHQLIVYLSKTCFNVDEIIGKIIALGFSIPVNFTGFKYWVFKEK